MWSLPDTSRLNGEAATEKEKLELAARTGILDGEQLECEWKDHDGECDEELRHYLWYDIFFDDPKGILTLCERHDGYYGSPSEGYFTCDGCNRVFVENYTWERYEAIHEGSSLCLPCFAYEVIHDEDRWIPLTDESIDRVTFADVRNAPHCVGVKMPVPKEIRFINDVEFDSMDSHCISGGGVDELKETLRTLRDEGETRAILNVDAADQFPVAIVVHAPTREPGEIAQPGMCVG